MRIVISQSGETADTIAAMRKAKENGVETLAIVNVKGSTIARESDKQIYIEAGPEIAVATTKAYILQVAVMALLACRVANESKIVDELKKLPRLLREVIDRRDIYLKIAKDIYYLSIYAYIAGSWFFMSFQNIFIDIAIYNIIFLYLIKILFVKNKKSQLGGEVIA